MVRVDRVHSTGLNGRAISRGSFLSPSRVVVRPVSGLLQPRFDREAEIDRPTRSSWSPFAESRAIQQIDKLIDKGAAQVALVIPPKFEQYVAAGKSAPVQMLVDGADGYTASIALGYAGQIAGAYNQHDAEGFIKLHELRLRLRKMEWGAVGRIWVISFESR